jgi:hypothetical protein
VHSPSRPATATLALLLLGGCGGGNLGSPTASSTVPLATPADALRELGNVASAARLAQAPLPGACSSGGDDIVGPNSKPRSFVYFSGFSGSVVYETHNYSACVDNGLTYDGLLEAGATSDNAYRYAVRGSPTAVLLIRSSGTDRNGMAVSIGQSQVGTIETHVSGSQTEVRAGLQGKSEQTPQSGGPPSYQGALSIGVSGPTFDVLTDSSGNGGNGSQTIAGAYSYGSTLCSGGDAAVSTASPLLLTSAAGGSYPTGGTLTVSSGDSTVTYTFSGAGAALSGSVSGALSSSQVQQAFSAGSGC